MRRPIVTLVCALAVSPAWLVMASTETQPVSPSSQPPNTQTITVRGCVTGRSIRTPPRPNDRDLLVTAPTYRLKGSKAMMDVLKEHDGHERDGGGEVATFHGSASHPRTRPILCRSVARALVGLRLGSAG